MKSLEIFSGAGGLAKGLELAGFEHSAFVEFNKHACLSLRENFDPGKVFFGDIRDFNLDQLSQVDVVAGGPPCQPFSLGGKHKADQDSRDMFPYAIRAIEKLSPKAFVFENVKGLLRSSFSDYFDYIILRLSYPGLTKNKIANWQEHLAYLRKINELPYTGTKYNVRFKLLNAADYGVPQTRERVVIVGIREDLDVNWDFPPATHSQERLLWEMHVTGDYWKRHNVPTSERRPTTPLIQEKISKLINKFGLFEPDGRPWRTMRDVLADLPDPSSRHELVDHSHKGGARTYPGHCGSDYDWPSKTIKAGGHGVPGGENMIRFWNGEVRYLTVLEAKRIQTFPDGFVIRGAWGEAMRQIGNAVPVLLAQTLGASLMAALNDEKTALDLKRSGSHAK